MALHEALGDAETDLDGLLQRAAQEVAQLLGDSAALWIDGPQGIELRAHPEGRPHREGAATVAVADVVIDLGADALQGYLYGRPAAADQISAALRSGRVAAHS